MLKRDTSGIYGDYMSHLWVLIDYMSYAVLTCPMQYWCPMQDWTMFYAVSEYHSAKVYMATNLVQNTHMEWHQWSPRWTRICHKWVNCVQDHTKVFTNVYKCVLLTHDTKIHHQHLSTIENQWIFQWWHDLSSYLLKGPRIPHYLLKGYILEVSRPIL